MRGILVATCWFSIWGMGPPSLIKYPPGIPPSSHLTPTPSFFLVQAVGASRLYLVILTGSEEISLTAFGGNKRASKHWQIGLPIEGRESSELQMFDYL